MLSKLPVNFTKTHRVCCCTVHSWLYLHTPHTPHVHISGVVHSCSIGFHGNPNPSPLFWLDIVIVLTMVAWQAMETSLSRFSPLLSSVSLSLPPTHPPPSPPSFTLFYFPSIFYILCLTFISYLPLKMVSSLFLALKDRMCDNLHRTTSKKSIFLYTISSPSLNSKMAAPW